MNDKLLFATPISSNPVFRFGQTLVLCALIIMSVAKHPVSAQSKITQIAFGSCGHEDHPLPIFDRIAAQKPDYFIFLGDNVYGDTYDMKVLQSKYDQLGANVNYQRLKQTATIWATWDDHDYGWNDTGRHYPFKAASKELFLSFFEEPADSPRRQRDGIYTSYYKNHHGYMIQFILLDNRTFRDDLLPYLGDFKHDRRYFYPLDYSPQANADSTLLGAAQWEWLEAELRKPADIRIIGSGTQFGIEYNGYEAWANFPHEQQKMLDLIQKTRAEGVLFITGDVHYGEISRMTPAGLYPIYDITSSGLSSTWDFATPNRHRIEGPIMDNHFGMIRIDFEPKDPVISLEIWDVHDNQRVEYRFPLSRLRF